MWLPCKLAGRFDRVLAIGSETYDSIVDIDLCDEMDAPGGDIGKVVSGGFDFSEVIPWRPEDYTLVHLDGALGTLGINFLENYRISIDRVNSWIGLTRTGTRPFPPGRTGLLRGPGNRGIRAGRRLVEELFRKLVSASRPPDLLLQMYVDDGRRRRGD